MRAQDEETRTQETRVRDARDELADALHALATIARLESRAAGTKTGTPDLDAVYAAVNRVTRAEAALDIAAYDLHTAAGGDG
jgi:hypothetical protein